MLNEKERYMLEQNESHCIRYESVSKLRPPRDSVEPEGTNGVIRTLGASGFRKGIGFPKDSQVPNISPQSTGIACTLRIRKMNIM